MLSINEGSSEEKKSPIFLSQENTKKLNSAVFVLEHGSFLAPVNYATCNRAAQRVIGPFSGTESVVGLFLERDETTPLFSIKSRNPLPVLRKGRGFAGSRDGGLAGERGVIGLFGRKRRPPPHGVMAPHIPLCRLA